MNIPSDTLNRWRAGMEIIRALTFRARRSAARHNRETTRELLSQIGEIAVGAGVQMEQLGADRPTHLPSVPEDIPLELLSSEANKRLLRLLTDAAEQARRVDQERGLEPGAGPTSALIEMIKGQVALECHGPAEAPESSTS